MNDMKNFLLFIFLVGFASTSFGQEQTIVKTLNRELQKEVKNQLKSPHFSGDTIEIVKPFSISTDKILSFEIKKTSPYFSGYQIIRQEVPLNKILKIGKDINIILECEDHEVLTTYNTFDVENKTEEVKGNLFFLYLSNEKQNEDLGVAIQKAFQKAGYSLEKEYWYD